MNFYHISMHFICLLIKALTPTISQELRRNDTLTDSQMITINSSFDVDTEPLPLLATRHLPSRVSAVEMLQMKHEVNLVHLDPWSLVS